MFTDLTTFIAYFNNISQTETIIMSGNIVPSGFKFFQHGDIERLISDSRSEQNFDYPLLWLETPRISYRDNDASVLEAVFQTAFVCLTQVESDDYELQDLAWNDMWLLTCAVIKKLNHDSKAMRGKMNFSLNSIASENISRIWVDSDYGWRTEFKISIPINSKLC
jgi:hypothetical protein